MNSSACPLLKWLDVLCTPLSRSKALGTTCFSCFPIMVRHVTWLACTREFPARFKDMAHNEGDENSVVLPSSTRLFDSELPSSEYPCDENSPLSPGEVRMMRNHPKVASVLFSPSRTTRGGEGKIKPKSFSTKLYASPTRKTVHLCC